MRTRRSRWIHALLLAALVGAQWLALVHGVLHARGLEGDDAAAVVAAADGSGASAGSWLKGLFAEHRHGSDCRLYDQSARSDHAPLALLPALPMVTAPEGTPRWIQRAWAARLVPQFRARAPPALG